MAVYVVTWNLNKEGTAYQQARTAFLNHLAKYDNTKDSQLERVRWVCTTGTASEVSDYLRQKLDSNDRLFVSKVNSDAKSGWLDKAVWDWINQRL